MAPWAFLAHHPALFAIVMLIGATLAMAVFHLGPAFLAKTTVAIPRVLQLALMFILAVGYLEWILDLTLGATASLSVFRYEHRTALLLALAFAGINIAVARFQRLWMPIASAGLLIAFGFLVWALVANWHGLPARNPTHPEPEMVWRFDWMFLEYLLVCAAPAVVIAWRIGQVEPEPRKLWLSGFLGVWLPLTVSIIMSTFAVHAGVNLYSSPTLGAGFYWALQSPAGLRPGAMLVAGGTLAWPFLLCGVSLRVLHNEWQEKRKIRVAAALAILAACELEANTWQFEGTSSILATHAHVIWAESIFVLGAAAGLACLIRKFRSAKGVA